MQPEGLVAAETGLGVYTGGRGGGYRGACYAMVLTTSG